MEGGGGTMGSAAGSVTGAGGGRAIFPTGSARPGICRDCGGPADLRWRIYGGLFLSLIRWRGYLVAAHEPGCSDDPTSIGLSGTEFFRRAGPTLRPKDHERSTAVRKTEVSHGSFVPR